MKSDGNCLLLTQNIAYKVYDSLFPVRILKLRRIPILIAFAALGQRIIIRIQSNLRRTPPDFVKPVAQFKILVVLIVFYHAGYRGSSHDSEIGEFIHRSVYISIASVLVVPSHGMASEIRYPFKHLPVLSLLYRMFTVADIGIMKRNGTSHGFYIISFSARRTAVNQKSRIALKQSIPEAVISLYMQIFQLM